MKDLTKGTLGLVFILVIAAYTLFLGVSFNQNFLLVIRDVLPVILIVLAAVLAQIKGKALVAGVALLFGFYSNAGSSFVMAVLNDINNVSLKEGVHLLIFLYLILHIFVHASNFKASALKSAKALTVSMAIAFLYFYFRDGFAVALTTVLPAFIALIAGSGLSALLLLIAGVVNVPVYVIGYFIDHPVIYASWNQKIIPLIIFGAFGLYLLVTGLLAIPKHLKE